MNWRASEYWFLFVCAKYRKRTTMACNVNVQGIWSMFNHWAMCIDIGLQMTIIHNFLFIFPFTIHVKADTAKQGWFMQFINLMKNGDLWLRTRWVTHWKIPSAVSTAIFSHASQIRNTCGRRYVPFADKFALRCKQLNMQICSWY